MIFRMNQNKYNFEKQHKASKMHAIERIERILDKNSFNELFSGMCNIEHFGISGEQVYPYDGVICGCGLIYGIKVFIYSQDMTVNGGTVGLNHAKKIVKTIELAIKTQSPIIGIFDSGGARLQEGVHSLAGYGEIFKYNTLASGYITQISIIAGNCAGGAAYSPGLTDFIFMIKNTSCAFVTGPKVIEQVTREKIDSFSLGGAELHSQYSGVSNFCCNDELDCYKKVRNLISMLFLHIEEDEYQTISSNFDINIAHNTDILAIPKTRCYDIHSIILSLSQDFLEVSAEFAKNMVIGFAHVGRYLIGIVANQPSYLAGSIDIHASEKAARFVRYCDCFDIPIITFVDTPGFFPSVEQEKKGIIKNGAKLLYAYAESTVPKVTIILRKAIGGAYIAMGSKHLGADKVFCYKNAEISIMGAKAASSILLKKVDLDEKQKFEKYYEEKYINSSTAIRYGYVDEIIEQGETYEKILQTLNELENKKEFIKLSKKHGNIPL